ncbi:MAG TPA: DUF2182 domain-containing protein [Thermoanaerobaculia bacterium]
MTSHRAFFGVSAMLFAVSIAVTIVWCGSMPVMHGMSMAWMRMPGQTWSNAAATFVGMWLVMMVAMMLPSLVPALWRYRRAVGWTGGTRLGRLTALVATAYFAFWTLFGIAVFPVGVALATLEMRHLAIARVVPIATGAVVLIAGVLQFGAWKAHHLACCRESPRGVLAANSRTALQHGLRLGIHCSYSSASATAVLLVLGVMDLRVMAIVTAAITIERLAPRGEVVARAIGVVAMVAGFAMIVRACISII